MDKTFLILINGQSGAGKSATAGALLQALENSAYIPTDSLMSVNPFEFGDKLHQLGSKNAKMLVKSFRKSGYRYIILCGLLSNQEYLDQFIIDFDEADFNILYVWLKVDKAIRDQRRINRARDDADRPEHFDVVDEKIPDLRTPLNVDYGKFIAINTENKAPSKVAEGIIVSCIETI